MSRIIEHSIRTKKNTIVFSGAILFFLAIVLFSIYKWVVYSVRQPVELFFELMFAAVIVERIWSSYIYEVDKRNLTIIKKSMFGSSRYEVSLRSIFGVYLYKPELISAVHFRRTYRLHSALDGRDVWTIAYTLPLANGKTENCRIFLKPGDQILSFLYKQLPDKVIGLQSSEQSPNTNQPMEKSMEDNT